MGEHFVKVDFLELKTATFFCPGCGMGLKFDLSIMPNVVGCSCGRIFPENERTIIGDLLEAFRMYEKANEKFKVEFELTHEKEKAANQIIAAEFIHEFLKLNLETIQYIRNTGSFNAKLLKELRKNAQALKKLI